MDAVDSNFFSTAARQAYNAVKAQLWSAIDSEINLSECDIYRQVFQLCSTIMLCFFEYHFYCLFGLTYSQNDYNSKLYHIIERKRREKSIKSYLLLYLFSNYSFIPFTAIILTSILIRMERTDAFGLTITFSTPRNSNGLCFSLIAHSGIPSDAFPSLKSYNLNLIFKRFIYYFPIFYSVIIE